MWRKIESTKNISSAKQTGWMLEISSKCRPFCCYLFQYAQKKTWTNIHRQATVAPSQTSLGRCWSPVPPLGHDKSMDCHPRPTWPGPGPGGGAGQSWSRPRLKAAPENPSIRISAREALLGPPCWRKERSVECCRYLVQGEIVHTNASSLP